ncbi:MAG TPA: PilZ domain-containing protein [Sphingomicrobium sp.]|nr:PilZ domain-containing protein [Sphingomicrobium sp.]
MTVQVQDLRRASRRRVLMRTTLITSAGAQQARVRDLTSTGAGIACQVPIEHGSDVILKRGDLFIAARVVWVDGNSAGLEFYREIPLGELASLFNTVFETA